MKVDAGLSGRIDAADRLARAALEKHRRAYGNLHQEVAEDLDEIGNAAYQSGRLADASAGSVVSVPSAAPMDAAQPASERQTPGTQTTSSPPTTTGQVPRRLRGTLAS